MSFIHKDPLLAATAINIASEVERQSNARVGQIQSDNSLTLQGQVVRQQQEISQLQAENQYYRSLLCQPMSVIAEKDKNFKQTYEKQQQLMADWIVSQKAFKELAIEFGFEDGLSVEEVVEMGNKKKLDVLDNKHDPKHGTNANGVNTLEDRIEATRERVLAQIKK